MTGLATPKFPKNERIVEAAKMAASLEEFFVRSSRHEEILTEISLVHEARLASSQRSTLRETRGFALIAPTGSGKTRTLEKVFAEIEGSSGKSGLPGDRCVLSVRVTTPATLKTVGVAILKELGYLEGVKSNYGNDHTFADVWETVHFQMQKQGIEILHLDEAQDLYESANKLQRISVINTLKSLAQSKQWPVCLVLSGIEKLESLLNDDGQLGRRFSVIGIAPLSYATDRSMVKKVVRHYLQEAGFETALAEDKEMLQRLIVASAGRLGVVIEIVIGAVKAAILAGSSTIDIEHFGSAYRRRTDCSVEMNPFFAEEWRSIDAQKILARADENRKTPPKKRVRVKDEDA